MGNLMGTPAFMPPEQARGDWNQVGAETDLWAVGATMYTLLSGHLVHEEVKLYDQLRAATTKPAPSLAVVLPDAPEPIVGLIDFALAFDGKNRWPNARSMQNALRVAYGEWKRTNGADPVPMDEALEMTERPIRLERPDAPPPSLARPSRF